MQKERVKELQEEVQFNVNEMHAGAVKIKIEILKKVLPEI